ncbi:MAG: hypothetical protein BroJett011_09250 [Chloroflexota bacterium]|nr:MAG: hypothetical protein BroJett011_09250 [Chloroflexota bacterium]
MNQGNFAALRRASQDGQASGLQGEVKMGNQVWVRPDARGGGYLDQSGNDVASTIERGVVMTRK